MKQLHRVPIWLAILLAVCLALTMGHSDVRSVHAQEPPQPDTPSAPVSEVPAKVKTGANLRAGPGTNYPRIGGAKAGETIQIVARNLAGDWYQLASGAWIFANLVENAPDVPVATNIPTPAVVTPSPVPSRSVTAMINSTPQVPVKVVTNANLRAGPGTNYPRVGAAKAGQTLVIVAQNSEGDWYQTAGGAWIFGKLLSGTARVPVASDVPAPPSSTRAPPPTRSVLKADRSDDTDTVGVGHIYSRGCSFADPLACARELFADDTLCYILLACVGLWAVALVLIMVRGRWRWVGHCILVTVLLLPIGWFVTLLSALLLLSNPENPTSPRELVQRFVDSTPAKIGLGLAFLIITAFTILGGVLIFAVLAIGYAIFLKLLPGPDYGSSPSYEVLSRSGSPVPGGAYLSDGSSYCSSDDSSSGYDQSVNYPDTDSDDDRNDDDRDSGSIWDGWLVKW